MKYVALVYYQERIIDAMTEKEWHDLNQECVAGVERLAEQGHFVAGQALQPIDSATTVRVRDDEVMVSDGPFAETKEQLAGRIPPARFGSIEVRPVRELPPRDPVPGDANSRNTDGE